MLKTIGYKEMLEEVELFMKKTSIREFCTNLCKGGCCSNCYKKNDDSCMGGERRLSCSVHLCSDIIFLLEPELSNYYRIIHAVEEGLKEAGQKSNVYYSPPSEEARARFFLPREELFSNAEKIVTIRCKIESLASLCGKHADNARVLWEERAKAGRGG